MVYKQKKAASPIKRRSGSPEKRSSVHRKPKGSPRKRGQRFSTLEAQCLGPARPWSAPIGRERVAKRRTPNQAIADAASTNFKGRQVSKDISEGGVVAVKTILRDLLPSSDTSPSPPRRLSPSKKPPPLPISTDPQRFEASPKLETRQDAPIQGAAKIQRESEEFTKSSAWQELGSGPDPQKPVLAASPRMVAPPERPRGAAQRWRQLRLARRFAAGPQVERIKLEEVRRLILEKGVPSVHLAIKRWLQENSCEDPFGAEEAVRMLLEFGVKASQGRIVFEDLIQNSKSGCLCSDELALQVILAAGNYGVIAEFRSLLQAEMDLQYDQLVTAFELMDRDGSGVVLRREFRVFIYELGASMAFADALFDIVTGSGSRAARGIHLVALREALRSASPNVDLTECAQRLRTRFGSLDAAAIHAVTRTEDASLPGLVSFEAFDGLCCEVDISRSNAQQLFEKLAHVSGTENSSAEEGVPLWYRQQFLPSCVFADGCLSVFGPATPVEELRAELRRYYGCVQTGLQRVLEAVRQLCPRKDESSWVDLQSWQICFNVCGIQLGNASLMALPHVLRSHGGFAFDNLEAVMYSSSPTRSPTRAMERHRRRARVAVRGDNAEIFHRLEQLKRDIRAPPPNPDVPLEGNTHSSSQMPSGSAPQAVLHRRPRSALLRSRLRRRDIHMDLKAQALARASHVLKDNVEDPKATDILTT